MSQDILTCSKAFIRRGAVKRPLTPAYGGHFQVLARTPKHFKLLVYGRLDVIAVDNVEPAYLDDPPGQASLAAPPSLAAPILALLQR